MAWRKLGRIHCLDERDTRSTTHMQVPAPLLLEDRVRVYFAARNRNGKSYPVFIDVARHDPTRVLRIREEPVMGYGPPGSFDDEGIMPACVVTQENAVWMYYSGWNRRQTVPYHNTAGIAVSHDGGETFFRMYDGPILERTLHEPYMAVTPWVIRLESRWQMWYVSGTGWRLVEGAYEPVYAIKYADSQDGIVWKRENTLAIPQRHPAEACAHPTVLIRAGRYHMWFCYRDSHDFRDGAGSYRIGYASSIDGLAWTRNDALAGIRKSEEGWDAAMLCYPSILEMDGRLLMFYNGNGFGRTGVGCAVWEGDLP